MENLIRNLNAVKECHDQYSTEQMLSMPANELKTICVKEKIKFIESLNSVDTKVIIRERIDILNERNLNEINKRREFLKSQLE